MDSKKNILLFTLFILALIALSLFSHPRRNVILITVDALRADHLPFYGYQRNTAPFLNELARTGLLFTNAHTLAPVSRPSHASILTGEEVARHGTITNEYPFNPDIPSLPLLLRSRGIKTGAFVGSELLSARSGLSQGFFVYDDSFTRGKTKKEGDISFKSAEHWISTLGQTPFFCWINLSDLTPPFNASEPFRGQFTNERLARYHGTEKELQEIDATQKKLSQKDIADLTGYYDEEVLVVDSLIKEFMNWLKLNKRYDNSVIIIAGSHGAELYDHFSFFGSALSMYDSVLKVPLLILNSGLSADRVKEPVFLHDLYPTIASIFDIEFPEKVQGVPLLKDAKLLPVPERTVVAVREPYPDVLGGNALAAFHGPWKMIRFFTGPQLYMNLEIDPEENTYLPEEAFPASIRADVEKWIEKNYWRQAEAKYRTFPQDRLP